MSVRSVQGFLLTVLGCVAALVLGVRLRDLLDPWPVVTTAVHGWRIACAAVAAGVVGWAVLALADFLGGRRAVLVSGVAGLILATSAFTVWEASYWQRHGFAHAVRVDGRPGPPAQGSSWRGVLGIPCGQPTIFDITIGPDGTGTGVVENYWRVPSLVLAVALAPLDGPHSYPVHVRLDGDSLRFRDHYDESYAISIH